MEENVIGPKSGAAASKKGKQMGLVSLKLNSKDFRHLRARVGPDTGMVDDGTNREENTRRPGSKWSPKR